MELGRLMKIDFKSWCIASGLFFLILYIILMLTDPPDHDVLLFYKYAMEFKEGTLFSSGVVSGYPPLSWIFIIVPGLFSDDLMVYYYIFAGVDVLCMFLIGVFLHRICENRTHYLLLILVVYLIMILLYSDHAVRKFDIVPALMMICSIDLFLRNRYGPAVFVSVIGALVKYFPALLIPVFIVMVMFERDSLKKTLKALLACIGIGLVGLAALLGTGLMDYNSILGFITSQDTRGFHIESLVGTFSTVFCNITGEPTWYVPSTDFTVDVKNAICDALIGPWMYIMLVVILCVMATVFLSFYKKHNAVLESKEEYFKFLTASALAMLLAFVLMNKVFSTQFMLWLFPLMIMFLCYRPKVETGFFLVIYLAMMVIVYFFLRSSSQGIMAIRDLLLIALMIISLRYVITRKWTINLDEDKG